MTFPPKPRPPYPLPPSSQPPLPPRRSGRRHVGLIVGLTLGAVVCVFASALVIGAFLFARQIGASMRPTETVETDRSRLAAAQAELDGAFPDYPVEMVEIKHRTGFMADQYTWRVRSRAHPDQEVTQSMSGAGDKPDLDFMRVQFKILRDGQTGEDPMQLSTPRLSSARVDSTRLTPGPQPAANFSTNAPYDKGARSFEVAIHLTSARLDPAADAGVVRDVLFWARLWNVKPTQIRLVGNPAESTGTGTRAPNGGGAPFDVILLDERAWSQPDLAGILRKAQANETVPGTFNVGAVDSHGNRVSTPPEWELRPRGVNAPSTGAPVKP